MLATHALKRRVGAISAASVIALAVAAAPAATAAETTAGADDITAVVAVNGMYYAKSEGTLHSAASGKSVASVAAAADLPDDNIVFEVTAPEDQIDALIDAKIAEAQAQIEADTATSPTGGVTPMAGGQNFVFGDCGSSYVILRTTSSQTQGQAYVEAGFYLKGVTSTGAYNTDTLVYSNAAADLWTGHLKDKGNLAGKTEWSKGTRFDLPKTQDYGAHFYIGTVQVVMNGQATVCNTLGPRVDNVRITVR